MAHEVRLAGRPRPTQFQAWQEDLARPCGGGKELAKFAGVVIMAFGALYTLSAAGSGLSTLVTVCLDNFGLVLLASTINFIFWTIMVFPIGGIIANAVCLGAGILVFGGLPAIPGAALTFGGYYILNL